ncbi:MAG: sigma-70 family RNA polymerase sigma factor [Eggerthellaceae bacterium]|nr:sigma-70 family RNA polymerase sigma factor [Eggerthellaceae bacterium]
MAFRTGRAAGRKLRRGGNEATCEDAADLRARRLVDAYADLILRVSYTYLRSTQDAEDICQTVLLKLTCEQHVFESIDHERAWVVRATINASKDVLRGAYRRTSVALDAARNAPDPASTPDMPQGSDVLDAVMLLGEKYREAVYLHYYEGYSIQEIADITGRSAAAVGAHLSRGRAKLREVLGDAAQRVDDELGPRVEPVGASHGEPPATPCGAHSAPEPHGSTTSRAHILRTLPSL